MHWLHRVPALALMASLVLALSAQAQPPMRDLGVVSLQLPGQPAPQRLYGESHALVIGASRYRAGWSTLDGVPGDVAAVERVLQRQGFQVRVLMNPTREQLDNGLRGFASTHGLGVNNRLLVYFAGHGYTHTTPQGKRLGYLVPVDAPRPDQDPAGFRRLAYGMENFEQLSRQIEAKHVLFLFDSCFSGTVFKTRSGVPDAISAKTDQPVRQFITAGDENQPVPDESIFRRQLERALGPDAEADLNGDGYITGTELGSFLEDKVTNYSRRSQTPRSGKLSDPDLDRGDFVFLSPRAAPSPPGPREADAWASCLAARTPKPCRTYGDLFPNGPNAVLARERAEDLEAPLQRPGEEQLARPPTAPGLARLRVSPAAGQTETFTVGGVSFKMVSIPAGSFLMGSPASEPGRYDDEEQHHVSVKSFQLGQTEVTQGLWQAVMGSNPSAFTSCGASCPVERVNWDNVQAFIRVLNEQTREKFRLPSEAEWEYAARAGSTTAYPWGSQSSHEYANYGKDECCGGMAQGRDRWEYKAPVGQFPANAFGLHDMHGNVWEWVQDCYGVYSASPTDGSPVNRIGCTQRVLRGGSWADGPHRLRSAERGRGVPDERDSGIGFRLARTVF